jgi:quinol-cytochrome oxidoreductase complex cytochrome b subunit
MFLLLFIRTFLRTYFGSYMYPRGSLWISGVVIFYL